MQQTGGDVTRALIRVSGEDPAKFLQGLVTNDLRKLAHGGIMYAALLSPQGKYLADFFLVADGDDIVLDVDAALSEDLFKRLLMYKLRTPVTLERIDMPVTRGTGPAPEGAVADPRHPALGWRLYGQHLPDDWPPDLTDWEALFVEHCIPQTLIELMPGETFILESGLARLNGVDFRKGCYVGQEVTARMQHKTELRKGLGIVGISEAVPVGTAIQNGERIVGQVFTQSGGKAIAFLRFDKAKPDMTAGSARITWPVQQGAAS